MLIPKCRVFSSLLPMCPGAFNDGCASHPMDERLQRKGILAAFAVRGRLTRQVQRPFGFSLFAVRGAVLSRDRSRPISVAVHPTGGR
jgi:hypothetical protein